MDNCDVCGKELGKGFQSIEVYSAKLLKRGVNKGKLGNSVASEYSKFEPVTVKVCRRHLRGFWNQRLIPGAIAFILILIPVMTLVSLIPVWSLDSRAIMLAVSMVITLGLVYLLVRRITYDGYVAGIMTLNSKSRQEKMEYFAKAKYRRMMKNFSRLDAVLKEDKPK